MAKQPKEKKEKDPWQDALRKVYAEQIASDTGNGDRPASTHVQQRKIGHLTGIIGAGALLAIGILTVRRVVEFSRIVK